MTRAPPAGVYEVVWYWGIELGAEYVSNLHSSHMNSPDPCCFNFIYNQKDFITEGRSGCVEPKFRLLSKIEASNKLNTWSYFVK